MKVATGDRSQVHEHLGPILMGPAAHTLRSRMSYTLYLRNIIGSALLRPLDDSNFMMEEDWDLLSLMGPEAAGINSDYGTGYAAPNPNPSPDQAERTPSAPNYPAMREPGDIFQFSQNFTDDYCDIFLPNHPIASLAPSPAIASDFSTFDGPCLSNFLNASFQPIASTLFGSEPTTLEPNIGVEHGISDVFDLGPTPSPQVNDSFQLSDLGSGEGDFDFQSSHFPSANETFPSISSANEVNDMHSNDDVQNSTTPSTESNSSTPATNLTTTNSSTTSRFHCTANGCNKSYKRYYDLLRHQRKHSGIKAHACHFARCNRSGGNGFERRDHLAQHLRQVHGV